MSFHSFAFLCVIGKISGYLQLPGSSITITIIFRLESSITITVGSTRGGVINYFQLQ